jgi:glutaredoxin
MQKIKIYGAQWCSDCRLSIHFLTGKNIPFEYIDIEQVAGAADEVTKINNGLQILPTIVFPDGTLLLEPTNGELEQILRELHYL